MQADLSIAPRLSWLTSLVIIGALALGSVFILAVVTDDDGDSSCGGG